LPPLRGNDWRSISSGSAAGSSLAYSARPGQRKSAMPFRSLPVLSNVDGAAGKALARLNWRVPEGVVTAPVRRLLLSR
jgi:hypothetical protein